MSSEYRIRPARASDAPEIVTWFPDRRAVVLWGSPQIPDPLTAPWLAREFSGRARAYFVAVDAEDRPVGVIGMRRRHGEARVHLIRIGVAPDRRGEGVAGKLVEAVAAVARAGGADRLTLNVYGSNTPAIRAYEKAGFAPYEFAASREDPSGAVVRMARDLGE